MVLEHLFGQLVGLYAIIILGYVLGKTFHIQKESIAKILLYGLLPFVVVNGVLSITLDIRTLIIPAIAFSLCSVMCFTLLFISSHIWKDGTANMISVGIANGNFGFIGFPLTLAIFGSGALALTALFNLGGAIFLTTIGMATVAKATYSLKESIMKILRMPILYGLVIGIIIKLLCIPIPPVIHDNLSSMTSAYSVFGLLLVGIAIQEMKGFAFNISFTLFTIMGTYILWPFIAIGVILTDHAFFHLLTMQIDQVVLLMSIVPVGANIVAIATEFNTKAKEASFAVLLTTFLSLIYIPLFIAFIFPLLHI